MWSYNFSFVVVISFFEDHPFCTSFFLLFHFFLFPSFLNVRFAFFESKLFFSQTKKSLVLSHSCQRGAGCQPFFKSVLLCRRFKSVGGPPPMCIIRATSNGQMLMTLVKIIKFNFYNAFLFLNNNKPRKKIHLHTI